MDKDNVRCLILRDGPNIFPGWYEVGLDALWVHGHRSAIMLDASEIP